MANIDYPVGLPMPLQEGYGLQHVSTNQVTEMDSGKRRRRQRFRTVPSNASVKFRCTEQQAQLFEMWFAASVDQGGIANGTIYFNCRLRTPIGIRDYECCFDDGYSGPTLIGGRYWDYTANLELKERPILKDYEWLQFPDMFLGASIIDRAINQEWPEA
ncbi:hypothetical protein [Salinicola sp. CPA57]|uniref:hypothetical protein n=1 Tax=Salinicola sp. CPA57 TaxID=1949080 RepID=UPI000DA232D0|nr:hypothetical protein [Salinicola sp. CPA57]